MDGNKGVMALSVEGRCQESPVPAGQSPSSAWLREWACEGELYKIKTNSLALNGKTKEIDCL